MGALALVEKNLAILWDEPSGMYMAASDGCRQIDIWAARTWFTSASPTRRNVNESAGSWSTTTRRSSMRVKCGTCRPGSTGRTGRTGRAARRQTSAKDLYQNGALGYGKRLGRLRNRPD